MHKKKIQNLIQKATCVEMTVQEDLMGTKLMTDSEEKEITIDEEVTQVKES